MDGVLAYLPRDRRQALAAGATLPELATGGVLFADLVGSTPLTTALARARGPQRGAEELAGLLDLVYGALGAELDRYGGSIIGYSGDALTAWFPADDGRRALACGLALQAAMGGLTGLRELEGVPLPVLKVAVSVGPVRRWLVGDPATQRIEVLAGATLDRLAAAEQETPPGAVVLDAQSAALLGDTIAVVRPTHGGGAAVVEGLRVAVAPQPWPAPGPLTAARARPWLLPAVYARLAQGQGEFLAELRFTVALFLRFGGLHYDADPAAGAKLDAYVRWVQGVISRYDGVLLQVTLGDKGSYLYAAFGAPIAHEDAPARAVAAAWELRSPPAELSDIQAPQIGISAGPTRAGAYGGTTRTYGVLGDAPNLAARLMQLARPGQVLLSAHVAPAVTRRWAFTPLAPIRVKGKAERVPVVAIEGPLAPTAPHPAEPQFALPLIGREPEIALVDEQIAQVLRGRGRIVGLTAEAGLGKSRLVAEVMRRAQAAGLTVLAGEGQATGTQIAWLAWQPIWRAFFSLDPDRPVAAQLPTLQAELDALNPVWRPRLPLLGAVLGATLPETDFTRGLDARQRNEALDELLVACLRARAATTPLLLVLDDAHWLDAVSRNLLTLLARRVPALPVLLLLAYRPADPVPGTALPLADWPAAVEIPLAELTPDEARRLIALKLAAAGPDEALPASLVDRILAGGAGNPFYIEELINYLQDRALPLSEAAGDQVELPGSLSSLILSRIDQLSPAQQTTLKLASVIGRVFPVAWLWGVHPELGAEAAVKADLGVLARLDLTALDSPEPDLRYLFKHAITQEVAYASLPFALREQLHAQLARWLEGQPWGADTLDVLAYHYGRSAVRAKQIEYFEKAGDAAVARYANAAAARYYERLLPLLPRAAQGRILLALGTISERQSAIEPARARYEAAREVGALAGDAHLHGEAILRLGVLARIGGAYETAVTRLEEARQAFAAQQDQAGLAGSLFELAVTYWMQANSAQALALATASREQAQACGDLRTLARSLQLLGNLTLEQDLAAGRALFEECVALYRAVGDSESAAGGLHSLGQVLVALGELSAARGCLEEAITLFEVVGGERRLAQARGGLARLLCAEGRGAAARALFGESLAVYAATDSHWLYANELAGLAEAVAMSGDPAALRHACALSGASSQLLISVGGDPMRSLHPGDRRQRERLLDTARAALGAAATEVAWAAGAALAWPALTRYALQLCQVPPELVPPVLTVEQTAQGSTAVSA